MFERKALPHACILQAVSRRQIVVDRQVGKDVCVFVINLNRSIGYPNQHTLARTNRSELT